MVVKTVSTIKWLKNISLLFALIFCVELIFGYSGTMLIVKGVAIRHILFIPTIILLYIYCFVYIRDHNIKWFAIKDKNAVFGSFTVLDWAVLLFIISTIVSFLLIPRLYGGDFTLAKSEILDSLCMLFLYYPIRFLIAWQEISFKRFEKFILFCVSLLAVLHIILYVGQTINNGFIDGYFAFLKALSGGTAQAPGSVLGHGGYPRVMYSTSLYLMVGLYLLLKKLPDWRIFHYVLWFLFVTALMTTMTKSLWYGVFIGLVIFTLCYLFNKIINKEKQAIFKWLLVLTGSVILIAVLNFTVFNGFIDARLANSFVSGADAQITEAESPDNSANSTQKSNKDLDYEGSVISNNIKIEQTEKLLAAWKEHPIFGVGYGAYLPDYLRSEVSPFAYEMLLPAMLFKIGLFGVAILFFTVAAGVYMAVKHLRSQRVLLFAWLFLLLSFGFCIQTNPLLLSFNGISIVLYILWCAWEISEGENR